MTNKSKFFAELKSENNKKKFSIDKKHLAKTYKVSLGLIDEFSYGDIQSLEDEMGRLSYSTEEWYDENFDKFIEARGMLRDVYFMNSEAFITSSDVERDREILDTLKSTADEIGVPVEDLYPDYEEHRRILSDLDYYEQRFEDQKRELEQYGF
jgi:hypothetical protein